MITETLQVQHLDAANSTQRPPHFHDMNELFFTMNSNTLMYIDHNEYQLSPGSLAFVSPGNIHVKISEGKSETESYIIHYPSSLLSRLSTPDTDLYAQFAELNACIRLAPEDAEIARRHFQDIAKEHSEHGNLHSILCFASILLTVMKGNDTASPMTPSPITTTDQWLLSVLKYLDSHLTEQVSLDDLAGKFGISKGSLCHTFKRKTGYTVVTYVNMQRIRYACILLRQGHSVRETCNLTGFTSIEHFIRTFHAFVDTTPGKYARAVQQHQSVRHPMSIYHASPDWMVPENPHSENKVAE